MNQKSTLFLLILSFFSSILFAQTTVKENDYTVTYNPDNIVISFAKDVDFKAFNAQAFTQKNTAADKAKQYTYVLTDVNLLSLLLSNIR